VAGTLAGDDTVLVVCRTPRAATRLSRDLIARLPR
jgi:arginine repressor